MFGKSVRGHVRGHDLCTWEGHILAWRVHTWILDKVTHDTFWLMFT